MIDSKRTVIALCVAAVTLGLVTEAHARHRRGGAAGRVVVAPRSYLYSYNPFWFSPFFYDPFFGPWYGYPGGGYPYGYRREASVRLDVRPRNANVYVDGYFAGTVDDFDGRFQRLHVTPGQHEIVVQLNGYRSLRERLYLGPNASRKISHDLERLPAGEPDDPIPSPTAQPPDGDHEVPGVRAPRRPPLPGRRPPARADDRTSRSGTLSIRVQPTDAEIRIDGERWAGSSDDSVLIVQLIEGPHTVEVHREGYRPVSLDVQVRSNETTPVNVSLSKE